MLVILQEDKVLDLPLEDRDFRPLVTPTKMWMS